jgi:tetratricopeptide (TPR) repeat protein
MIIVPAFFAGFLNCYYAKISTGDFIDEKNLLSRYMVAFFLSVCTGFTLNLYFSLVYTGNPYVSYFYTATSLFILAVIGFIKIPFLPENLVAQHYSDEELPVKEIQISRDDLFYTYLNFSYITLYLFMGLVVFIKFFGNIYYFNLVYISMIMFSIVIGMYAGGMKKFSFWHVYSEMLFPVLFITSLFVFYNYENKINPVLGFLILALPSVFFGFSLKQTVLNTINNYSHDKRFNIINFSMFILPVPIVLAASLVHYTALFFFIMLYTITILNIIIPGVYLFNTELRPGKKFLYFLFSLCFVPSIVFIHLYYKVPVNNKPFINNIANFEMLKNTNFNMPYIAERGEIKSSGSTIFFLSESTIRNLKRAAAASSLFCEENTKMLILDSNQKFFRNPLFGYYTGATCIDNIPSGYLNNSKLPVSGRQTYIPREMGILSALSDNTQYNAIIDSPNLLDQNFHAFRFSREYFSLIKKHLTENGVYITIFDLHCSDYRIISESFPALSEKFRYHLVFIFSNISMIVSSDSTESLKISQRSIARLKSIIENKTLYGLLFFNEIHPLNNIIFNDLNIFQQFLITDKRNKPYIYTPVEIKNLSEQLAEFYLSYHNEWMDSVFPDSKEDANFKTAFKSNITKNSAVLDIIKRTEYAESINAYDQETSYLFQLKKYTPYNDDLRKYLQAILEYKENFYYSEALRLEKEKKWDDAAILYRAILTMNSNNFEANYRFGLLYITLQDMTNAFKYLDTALKLNKNHPQVLYQMGILMFSSDKFRESIEYFEKARELGVNTAALYLYLGISYEKTKNLEKAKENFEKAMILDPDDTKLKSLMDELNKKILIESKQESDEGKTNMADDEQGEEIKIPVNKKAIKARINDDEKD